MVDVNGASANDVFLLDLVTVKFLGDYLTKPLPRATFEPNRERVQGW